MANKLYAMELLTEEVAKDVAANPQEWMRFLNLHPGCTGTLFRNSS